eukprot:1156069-Pelagomonas_calceolata.AAC.5
MESTIIRVPGQLDSCVPHHTVLAPGQRSFFSALFSFQCVLKGGQLTWAACKCGPGAGAANDVFCRCKHMRRQGPHVPTDRQHATILERTLGWMLTGIASPRHCIPDGCSNVGIASPRHCIPDGCSNLGIASPRHCYVSRDHQHPISHDAGL